MRIRVALFAVARERAGESVVEIELPSQAAVADLRAALIRQFPKLADILPVSRIAVNAEYVPDAALIPPAAEVALIPPVSGG